MAVKPMGGPCLLQARCALDRPQPEVGVQLLYLDAPSSNDELCRFVLQGGVTPMIVLVLARAVCC